MTVVIDKGHSRFGGSQAPAYMECAASAPKSATVPNMADDDYNSDGTAAHFVAEQCLKKFLPASHFLDYAWTKPGSPTVVVTGNTVDAVEVYLRAVEQERTLSVNAELYVEQPFELETEAAPGEVWGTNDAMVYHPETGRLRVFDYKHGVGVSVSADDNAQLKFYAAGAVFAHPDWKISEVVLTIVQPRARDVDEVGAVKDWSFDVVELLEFVGDLETAIAKAKEVEARDVTLADFKTGSWCRWCDYAGVCEAKEVAAVKAATLDEDGFATVTEITARDFPEPKSLDLERLARVVAGIDLVREWQLRCQELLEGLILAGHSVPGWKAVEKIGRAKWVEDPAELVAYAGALYDLAEDQLMPRKLTTIGDAEKLLKGAGASKEQIDDFKLRFTIKESNGLTIAPSTDRRPSVDAAKENFGGAKL